MRGWLFVGAIWIAFAGVSRCIASDASPAAPVPRELIEAIKSLKGATAAARQKVYDLLETKGDARLIPALKAYRDGFVPMRDDRHVGHADPINHPRPGP